MSSRAVHAAARSLEDGGWAIDAPEPAQANRERILDRLGRASLFFFYGHGEHDDGSTRARALPPYAGGTTRWPARLRLAPPTVLEVHDVLTLASAPRFAVLLGCETGVPSGTGGGMSLALAFLTAGAEAVIASPEVADSAISFATGVGLLERVSATAPDLTRDLAVTQAAMLTHGEQIGRYRVWVR